LINRINLRTNKMLRDGAIQEVEKFKSKKIKKDSSVNKVIGIKELKKYLKSEITLDQASELIAIRTRQYAKRQATWARSRMLNWNKIHPGEISSLIKKINKLSLKLDQLI
jgi:tRNA dimethylallyltransferase